jgi:HEAT repeat protein
MFFNKEKKIERWAKKKNSQKLAKEINNPELDIRLKVISALADIGDFKAVSALMSVVKDEDPKIRIATLEALDKLGNEKAKEHVRYLSEKDEDPEVKEKAKQVLSSLASRTGIGV